MGEYGRNCENRCGHCHNHEACNRLDGRCRDCETGYQGLRCDNGRSNVLSDRGLLNLITGYKQNHK